MEFANSGWKTLVDKPLRVPEYLRRSAEDLSLLAEPLANVVGNFLQCKARPLVPELRREADCVHDPEIGPAFDCHHIAGEPSIRVGVPSDTVDLLCPLLFGGAVKEVMLRTAAGQGLGAKIAAAVLSETRQSMAAPTLTAPKEHSLSALPVLFIDYSFDLEGDKKLAFSIAFTRAFTDQLHAPEKTMPQSIIDATQFQALAVATEQMIPVDQIDSWKPGSIVSLKKASTERVTLLAVGKTSQTPIALGELGTDDNVRCLRLTHVGTEQIANAAPAMASGFGAGKSPNEPPPAEDAPAPALKSALAE